MTLELFIFLVTVGATLSSGATQVVKNILDEVKVTYSSNIVAIGVAVVIGLVGAFIGYTLLDVDITVKNVIYAFLVSGCVGGCSTFGYDKVVQTIKQISGGVSA